jgi:hypothetical protein
MALHLMQRAIAQGSEVENTTTEGSFAQYAFAANELQIGAVYMLTGTVIVNDSNSTDTLTCRLRFGSNASAPASNTAIVATSATDVADGDIMSFTAYMQVRSTGSAGACVFWGFVSEIDAEAAATTPAFAFHQVVSSLDTTAALYFDASGTWSVAHADNEAAADAFVVTLISP